VSPLATGTATTYVGSSMKKLRVDVWSDIVCPWCFVGKRRLEAALARFAHRDGVEVVWRAFELDPAAPPVRDGVTQYGERLAKKYGTTVEQAEKMIGRMTDVAAADGLVFRFDHIQPGNTFNAHRLLHLAKERGSQDALKERLLRAYMTEGEAIGATETLERLAAEVGLDVDEVRRVLASDVYATEVRADEEDAHRIGITGVPFFVFDFRYAVSGAQPADILLAALTKAWDELDEEPPLLADEGAVCGIDGCD
jgi:predicted DsbA family dithiol-disulfide isomerase